MNSLGGDTALCPSLFDLEGPQGLPSALENEDGTTAIVVISEIGCMARVDICSVKVIP